MGAQFGKIGPSLFDRTIAGMWGKQRPEVRIGPAFGVDVALVDLPHGMVLAMSSDPLSLIPTLGLEASAWLSVHLMANDIATTGHAPMYGQFVLNLPTSMSADDFERYWQYIHRFCSDIGVAITGGHTGFIAGQDSTISGGGTLCTVVERDKVLTSAAARAGDVLLVTKQCALSSTAILAMSFPETVRNLAGTEIQQEACNSFYRTSSLPDALTAVKTAGISAMHDVTEGGVLGAIYELAMASSLGAKIVSNLLPVSPVQEQICRIFDLDYRYCVGAGALILACQKEVAIAVIQRLDEEGIACTVVGELCRADKGVKLLEQGQELDVLYQGEDPYWASYYQATLKGWK